METMGRGYLVIVASMVLTAGILGAGLFMGQLDSPGFKWMVETWVQVVMYGVVGIGVKEVGKIGTKAFEKGGSQ